MITIYDTITYSRNILVEEPRPILLQERYFPTSERDFYQTRKVLVDYVDADRKIGACVKHGYIDGNTTNHRSNLLETLRVGISDKIDLNEDTDRQAFEQLMYSQGEMSPTRSDAYNQLLRLKATRLMDRAQRRTELTIANIFMNNGFSGTIPTSPTDPTPIDIDVSFAPETGNDQRYAPAIPWGTSGATPYRDVCAMIDDLTAHGGDAEDLLISPEAWLLLRNDEEFKGNFNLYSNQYEGELFAKDIKKAKYVGRVSFGGTLLNIIVDYDKYVDDENNTKPFLEKGFVCVTAPGCGRTLFGGCVKINRAMIPTEGVESSLEQRFGKYILTKKLTVDSTDDEMVTICLESHPLPVPWSPWRWITMDAMNTNKISNGEQGVFNNLLLYSVDGAKYDSVDLPIENWVRNAKKGSEVSFDYTKAVLSGYTWNRIIDDNGKTLSVAGGKFVANGTTGVFVEFASTISFDANGGSGSMTGIRVVYGKSYALKANTFTKSGYHFVGWALSSSGDAVYDDQETIVPTGDVTLYAVWEAD